MMAAARTFIRAAEYWVPSSDGSLLEFGGGIFGGASRLAATTPQLCFGRGEGLPGQAWENGYPVVLPQLDHSNFRRADAARAAGITCGVAIPLWQGPQLRAVVVLFCGDDEQHAGAIELWRNVPEASPDMGLVDGYSGTTGDTFEFISRSTQFRRGTGLPGLTWERQAPVFLDNLGKGSGFLRADSAVRVGINRAYAFPCSTSDGSVCVMAFLSALATPIARRLETWQPTSVDGAAVLVSGFCESSGTLGPAQAATSPLAAPQDQALLAQVMAGGAPAITGSVLLLPITPAGQTTAVVALQL